MTKAKKLSTKRRVFVEAYLANGFNGTQAAIAAGYSVKRAAVTASEILSDDLVKAYIEERMKQAQMSADEVLFRLGAIARGDMRELMMLSPEELKKHPKAWLVKKLKMEAVIPKTEKTNPTSLKEELDTPPPEPLIYIDSIEMYDAQAALVILGKHHKLFTDKHEISGEDGKPIPVLITGMNMDEL